MTQETSNEYMDRFMKIGEEIRLTEKEIEDLEDIMRAINPANLKYVLYQAY